VIYVDILVKLFIDWLRGFTCYSNCSNVNRNNHIVSHCWLHRLLIYYVSVCKKVIYFLFYNLCFSII